MRNMKKDIPIRKSNLYTVWMQRKDECYEKKYASFKNDIVTCRNHSGNGFVLQEDDAKEEICDHQNQKDKQWGERRCV